MNSDERLAAAIHHGHPVASNEAQASELDGRPTHAVPDHLRPDSLGNPIDLEADAFDGGCPADVGGDRPTVSIADAAVITRERMATPATVPGLAADDSPPVAALAALAELQRHVGECVYSVSRWIKYPTTGALVSQARVEFMRTAMAAFEKAVVSG